MEISQSFSRSFSDLPLCTIRLSRYDEEYLNLTYVLDPLFIDLLPSLKSVGTEWSHNGTLNIGLYDDCRICVRRYLVGLKVDTV